MYEFKIVVADSPIELHHAIKDYILDGWRPVGAFVYVVGVVFQSLERGKR